MNLFAILREHAKARADVIASRSSRRSVTYRKLWSRIERATARMKDEWQVKAGDTVIYYGCGNQDALMYYLAAARCGAKLLPLEHSALQHAFLQHPANATLSTMPAALLLHDDEIVFETQPAAQRIVNLSALIATRCHHTPLVQEDDSQSSLLNAMMHADGKFKRQEQSLHGLVSIAKSIVVRDKDVPLQLDATLFDEHIFAPLVLPRLIAGGLLQFR